MMPAVAVGRCGHHELGVVCPLCAADAGELLLYGDSCCRLQLK